MINDNANANEFPSGPAENWHASSRRSHIHRIYASRIEIAYGSRYLAEFCSLACGTFLSILLFDIPNTI